ncbi:hypothetical protein pipiens_010424 [Culex pipiens pipiens]|uniref:Uncharacterized protein n=1 Tax=Culex pipiens pipiens TaxID=38569 RepID=A0ABD1DAJ9_CULPP
MSIRMGAKMSRRKGRKAAAAAEEAGTVEELATPRTDETDVDRVAGGGRVDGGTDSAGGIPEPDPPVLEQNLTDSCLDHSDEPADPVPEAPVGESRAKSKRLPLFRYRIHRSRSKI